MSGGRQVRAALLLLLLLLCYAMALGSCGSLAQDRSVTLYLPQGSNSYSTLLAAEQRIAAPLPFVLWQQQEGQGIATTALGRTGRAAVVTVYGNSAIVLPSLGLLLPEGRRGCLLDAQSCYALFGDYSPVGEGITLDGTNYVIVGVFQHPTRVLVRQGAPDGGSECNRITLALPPDGNPTQVAEDFALRHGLRPVAIVSGTVWAGMAGALVRLLPLVLLGWLLYKSLRLAAAHRATPVLAGMVACGTLVVAVLFWQLCGLGFAFPATLIPTRWSDFEFWTTTLAGIKEQLWQLLTLEKELPHAIALAVVLRCAAWSVGVLLLLPWALRGKVQSGKELFALAVCCLCASLAASIAAQTTSTALWLMLPCFFGWGFLLNVVEQACGCHGGG